MIEGLKDLKYVQTSRKRFSPLSLIVAFGLFFVVITASLGPARAKHLMDVRGLFIVVGGTFASIVFQFDLKGAMAALFSVIESFVGTPDRKALGAMREIDKAILDGESLSQMRSPDGLSGSLINDVVYMQQRGLTFDEIDAFITSRIKDEYQGREVVAEILQRASIVAPSFGLFGTVIGLVQVMQSMSSPGSIGPAMSLALMTTAYGAGLASLVFTPLAGRIEHHNRVYLECHRQLLSKIGILIKRDERDMNLVRGK